METRRQGLSLVTAACVLIGVVVVIQLWLLSAALDALFADGRSVLFPTAIASLALAGLNAGLLWYVSDFDARLRRTRPDG